MSLPTIQNTMETTTASSVSDYMVVRLPATPEEGHEHFKESIRSQFAFMTRRFTFTSEYTYVRFLYPDYAQTAAHILAGDLVETETAPLLIQEVFGGMNLPEPELIHAQEVCDWRTCPVCAAEEAMYAPPAPCHHCGQPECAGFCRDCEDCGRPWCKGECYDRQEDDGYESDEHHGPRLHPRRWGGNRCRCCGYEDDEVGNRYAGYCGYDCAHEAREW